MARNRTPGIRIDRNGRSNIGKATGEEPQPDHARNLGRDDDLVHLMQKSCSAPKEKGLHRCNPLIKWRARQESNPRPPGS